MKLTCSKSQLLESINLVSRAVSSKPQLKILDCVLITVGDDGTYKMAGNNLELGIETLPSGLAALDFEPGKTAIDARLFSDIVRRAPDGDIAIVSDANDTMTIRAGRSKFNIAGQSGEQFPFLADVPNDKGFKLPAAALRDMIRRTIFSVAADELKPIMTGELIQIDGGSARMVSVDGFRVSVAEKERDGPQRRANEREPDGPRLEAIIPGKTLSEIANILKGSKDEFVTLYSTDKHMLFELKNCTVVSRLLEGEFMRYDTLFDVDFKTIVVADKDELLEAIERASLVGRDTRKYPVRLSIADDKAVIRGSTEIGSCREEIDIEVNGEPIDIAFNPRYLTDILKVMDDRRAILSFQTPLSPCIIKGEDMPGHRYLVLPLRVKG